MVVGFSFASHRHRQGIASTVLSATTATPQESVRRCPLRIVSEALLQRKGSTAVLPITAASNPITDDNTEHRHQNRKAASIAKIGLVSALASSPKVAVLSPMERWCVDNIEEWYEQALAWKCPFLRRRASDLLDAADMLMRFLIVRNKASLLGPPPSLRGVKGSMQREKTLHLTREELMEVIRKDWRSDNNKGYYITGKLSTNIYTDDCLFDGPDPDMPVKGLRKYLNAASQLFEQRRSRAELLTLQIEGDVIIAKWRFNGRLRLPWKPRMPEVTGTTIYNMNEDGLICRHEETWDISAYQAFFWTMMPERFSTNTSATASRTVKKHLREALLLV